MGNSYATKLVSVAEKTDYLDITGFIGKPDTARKTRGDQYLFVNNRFIRSPYLTHAIVSAYESLIPESSFPFFAIFLDLEPAKVDVNVHPTKQEIKFEDEKIVYAFIKSAIRHALAQFSIAPSMDFQLDPSIQFLDAVAKPFSDNQQDETKSGGLYKSFVDKHQAHRIQSSSNLSNWKDFFESNPNQESIRQTDMGEGNEVVFNQPKSSSVLVPTDYNGVSQLHQTYIMFEQANGITILHQQLAHQQVLFEKFINAWQGKGMAVQQNLFPVAINLSPADAQILQTLWWKCFLVARQSGRPPNRKRPSCHRNDP
jgi:DNA mismatch repair protein MutL